MRWPMTFGPSGIDPKYGAVSRVNSKRGSCMDYPIIHPIADAIGHVDLNETRVVFGTPDNMLPNPDDYPDADCRGLVIAKHRDHPVATPDEFVAIVDAL